MPRRPAFEDSASTLGNVLPLLLLCIDLLSRSGLPTLKSYESYHLSYVVASGTGCPAGQPLALQCQWALTGTATSTGSGPAGSPAGSHAHSQVPLAANCH